MQKPSFFEKKKKQDSGHLFFFQKNKKQKQKQNKKKNKKKKQDSGFLSLKICWDLIFTRGNILLKSVDMSNSI